MKLLTALAFVGALGCGSTPAPALMGGPPADSAGAVVCSAARVVARLPRALHESSGVATSGMDPDLLWSHDDSGAPPVLFALDTLGAVLGRVRVSGASNVDWEDIARGPCPDGGSCLWIADTGDNHGSRRAVTVYRVTEPRPGASVTAPAARFVIRYPDGAHDVEALAVSPRGSLYLVSKGDLGRPRTIFVVERPRTDSENLAQPLARLGGPRPWVTGADLSADGRWLVLRTHRRLRFFRVAAPDRLEPVGGDMGVDISAAGEPQGEGVALRRDGVVFLTSEARNGRPARLSRLSCTLPR